MPDFEVDKPPGYRPPTGAHGPEAIAGDEPFIMQADGRGWLYAPAGVAEGPLPTHYEPQDSPVRNLLHRQQRNPARQLYRHESNRYHPDPGAPGADVFPFVLTTYRLTEHFTAGGMSRWTPYLSELQPELFCEVSPELAAERGLEHGGWATHRQRARRDRGARDGHRPHDAAAGRRARDPPDRHALPLGPERVRARRRR